MPISKWHDLEKEAASLQPPVDRMDRCAALGVDITAKLGKQGVVVFGNHYSCEETRALYADGKTPDMQIRVDTSNLGMVAVGVDGQWVKALPHTRAMEGISLPEWEEQCRALRTRFKHEAELSAEFRAHAAKAISNIASDARARLRRQQATLFGHSAAYVQHLHSTLFLASGFGKRRNSVLKRLRMASAVRSCLHLIPKRLTSNMRRGRKVIWVRMMMPGRTGPISLTSGGWRMDNECGY